MTYDAQKRPMRVSISTWGPTGHGLRFANIDLPDSIGGPGIAILAVTIEDGDREVSYDTESYEVTLTKKDREVKDFADDQIPLKV